jgi:hypothetical protein
MIVGCYSLELYCENQPDRQKPDSVHGYEEFPSVYAAQRREDCERAARKDGWMINNKTGVCLCPKCSGKHNYK